jgi:predicted methyltransferase
VVERHVSPNGQEKQMRNLPAALTALLMLATAAYAGGPDLTLQQAVESSARNPAFVARDSSRHPLQELEFFGIKPNMTVVEIWPSKGYWTEILAPYLHNHGTYYVATEADEPQKEFDTLLSNKDVYGAVKVVPFGKDTRDLAPAGSVDAVLTFRNLHNWLEGGYADSALASFYKALKPGGVLGIEDHRGLSTLPQNVQTPDGYVQEEFAIKLAKQAGFEFVASSPIDDNPKDTKRWPKGVWTLPPSFALGDKDRAKYQAIGEADNFVLLFRKPMAAPANK